jgi:beta-amylase
MLASLQSAATAAGHTDWGYGGPNDAGNYNSRPEQTGFFQENTRDNYESDYGRFFLSTYSDLQFEFPFWEIESLKSRAYFPYLDWYSSTLIQHGAAVLAQANASLGGRCNLAAKVSGVHWYYNTPSHAAELTAGYNNAYQDGYKPVRTRALVKTHFYDGVGHIIFPQEWKFYALDRPINDIPHR